ncbi:MAG: DoxX family protein [Chloroflexota bacterium]|nr:DoxX family protein [Chloroflexota bacterium]
MAARIADRRVGGIIWLALRWWLASVWLTAGWGKVFGDRAPAWVGEKAGTAVTGFLGGALEKTGGDNPEVLPWYAAFIREVALPNATLFGYLVAYGELLVALALVVGLFTRFAALMGVLMNLAYLFAGVSSQNPQMLLAEAAIVFAGGAAGYYGLDRYVLPAIRARLGWGDALAGAGVRSGVPAAAGSD